MLKPSAFSVTLALVMVAQLPGVAQSAPRANLVLACPDENAIGQDFESCHGYVYEIPTNQLIVFSPATLWSRASDLTASDSVIVCTIPVEPRRVFQLQGHAEGVRRTAYIAKAFVFGGPALYVTSNFDPTFDHGRIERLTIDGEVREVVREVGGGLRGLAVDVDSNSLFWTDVDTDRIERVDLHAPLGSPSGVVTTGLSFPFGLDLSMSASRLFWADQSLGHVETSKFDGTGRQVLFSAVSPASVAVDDVNGKIYSEDRSEIPEEAGRLTSIVRSNFDGMEFEEITSDVPTANDLAIDPFNEVIYWTSSAGLTNGNGGV